MHGIIISIMSSKPVLLLLGARGQIGKLIGDNLRGNDVLELRKVRKV